MINVRAVYAQSACQQQVRVASTVGNQWVRAMQCGISALWKGVDGAVSIAVLVTWLGTASLGLANRASGRLGCFVSSAEVSQLGASVNTIIHVPGVLRSFQQLGMSSSFVVKATDTWPGFRSSSSGLAQRCPCRFWCCPIPQQSNCRNMHRHPNIYTLRIVACVWNRWKTPPLRYISVKGITGCRRKSIEGRCIEGFSPNGLSRSRLRFSGRV